MNRTTRTGHGRTTSVVRFPSRRQDGIAPKIPSADAPPEVWAAFWARLADWAPAYRASWGRSA